MYREVPCERDWREHEEFFSRKISVHFEIYVLGAVPASD